MTDVNDNSPMFDDTKVDFTVTEGAFNGSIIGVVMATDGDEGINADIEYRFTNLITDGRLDYWEELVSEIKKVVYTTL